MALLSQTFQRAPFDLLLDESVATADTIRSLPDLIQFNAVHNAHFLFCVQFRQSKRGPIEKGVEEVHVTFSELATAIERCCVWILSKLGGIHSARLTSDGSVQKGPPVALFLESGVTLFVYMMALLTMNVPCLLLSIRLNPPAVQHLLDETGSDIVIVSPRTRKSIEDGIRTTSITEVAEFESFLSTRVCTDAFISRALEGRQMVREDDRNVLILHSSGTTGLPKAIPLAHRYVLGYAACHEFPITEDVSLGGYNLSTLPLFHGFGVLAPSLALSVGKPVCFPPSTLIPNGSLVMQLIKRSNNRNAKTSMDTSAADGMTTTRITSLMTVPSILEDVTLMPDFDTDAAIELAKLSFVVCGGGGIKTSVGSKLHAKGVTLLNHFGATELGALAPIFQPTPDYDWTYLRLRTDLGLRLETVEQAGNQRICKLVGYPFAWKSRFELQDKLQANPLKIDSEVKILGRTDDLIVLATGEKVWPYPLESALELHPQVRRAVIFGNGQFEIGMLIEPIFDSDSESSGQLIDNIWPKILEGNELMDSHARISSKSAILLKPADTEIPLTDKGSVRRKEVDAVFKSQIESVYQTLAQDEATELAVSFSLEYPEESLREIAQKCLPIYNKAGSWSDESDFVAVGMDSLCATRFRRILSASLCHSGHAPFTMHELPLDIIYTHPSILSLAKALKNLQHGPSLESSSAEKMQVLLDKYTFRQKLPAPQSITSFIVITGSTGNLGANILHTTSADPCVQGIICLIRPASDGAASSLEDVAARQRKALKDRGIFLSNEAWSKISCLPWMPGVEYLGMAKNQFHAIATQLTHIFHGAWPMDFKVKVQSLEPQIHAVRELLGLACLAHSIRPNVRPRVVLASSIAVVGQYAKKTRSFIVPETAMDDPETPLPIGYAEAKWVCEKLMQSAFEHSSEVEPTIIRIGQVSGSQSTGFWSSKEHIPALIKASKAIGAMPDLRGSLSWIPVDRAAQAATDIMLGSQPLELVYHLENPIRQSWPDMCTVIERNLSLETVLRMPFEDWLDKVAASNETSQDLIDFFRNHFLHMSSGSLILDTTLARKASSTLRSTGSVDIRTIGLYLDHWRRTGFLK